MLYGRKNLVVKIMSNSDFTWDSAHDAALLNEIDDIIRKKMRDLEKAGATMEEIQVAVAEYGQMFDFIEAKISGYGVDVKEVGAEFAEDLAERSYYFLEECFFEKLESIYAPNRAISDEQADKFIKTTRQKLQRLENALFNRTIS